VPDDFETIPAVPKTKGTPKSMSMIEPRFRDIYLKFYKESYFTPTALDLKTKELIAIGASLVAKCEGCLEGHIKKALEIGCTKQEVSDAIVIAVGIAAAGIVDMSDKAAVKLDIHHYEGVRALTVAIRFRPPRTP
jgi:AhpD family alkylhydroperoxidase